MSRVAVFYMGGERVQGERAQDCRRAEDEALDEPVDAATRQEPALAVEPDGSSGEEVPGSEASGDGQEELRAQLEELSQRLLRTQADFDNFRKRTRQEKEELTQYANAKLIVDLLPVMDNFFLAMQAAQGKGDTEALMKGVDMVFRQLAGVLEKAGVRTMEPVGEPFDPNRHEAVLSETAPETQAGLVLEVLRTGYLLHERVLRPAMVKVSQ